VRHCAEIIIPTIRKNANKTTPARQICRFLGDTLHFLTQLSGIHLGGLLELFLMILLLVGAGFDMGAINEDCAWVYHAVIQGLFENMFKDFFG
jgi:hypothetical protein